MHPGLLVAKFFRIWAGRLKKHLVCVVVRLEMSAVEELECWVSEGMSLRAVSGRQIEIYPRLASDALNVRRQEQVTRVI